MGHGALRHQSVPRGGRQFPGTGKKTADTDLQAVPAAKDSLGLSSGEIPKRDVGWRSAAAINFRVKSGMFCCEWLISATTAALNLGPSIDLSGTARTLTRAAQTYPRWVI